MKNENKIVELLTEMVRKQDQHEEILKEHTHLFGEITDRLDQQGDALGRIVHILDGISKRLSEFDNLNERLTRVEQHLNL